MVFGAAAPHALARQVDAPTTRARQRLSFSATSQLCFSLRTNQPLVISQHYFSLTTNQHQSSATSQTNALLTSNRHAKAKSL
jgi:hypothetical protein